MVVVQMHVDAVDELWLVEVEDELWLVEFMDELRLVVEVDLGLELGRAMIIERLLASISSEE